MSRTCVPPGSAEGGSLIQPPTSHAGRAPAWLRLARYAALAGLLLLGVLITLAWLRDPDGRRGPAPRQDAIVRWWHRQVLRALGVRLRVFGRPAREACLVVANHVSWVDIPVLGATAGARPDQTVDFVAKGAIRSWPVVGWLAARTGTLFLVRQGSLERQRAAASHAARHLARRLRAGRRPLVFPEGGTGDGRCVRRFHARLFAAAVEAGALIQPAALRYPDLAGGPVHPLLPFVGGIGLPWHAWRLCGLRRIEAEVAYLEPFPPVGPRRELAERARAAVADWLEQAARCDLSVGCSSGGYPDNGGCQTNP